MGALMSTTGPPYGSAAGIPMPPEVARTTPSGPSPGGGSHQRRRWLRFVLLSAVIVAICIVALVVGASRDDGGNGLDSLRAGDCIDAPDASGFTKIATVDCAEPHSQEVYAVGTTTKTIATGVDAIHDPEVIRICNTDVDPRILQVLRETAHTNAGFLVDSTKSGTVVCTAISDSRTGSFVADARAIAAS